MAVKAVKKEPAKNPEAEAAAAPPPKKSKLKLIVGLLVLILAGGGGGAFWFLNRHDTAPKEAKAQPEKPPVFQAMDPFTVNLQAEDGQQFLQTAITLRVTDTEAADLVKTRIPEIRNAVLMLLSARKASDLLSVEGKRKLGSDISVAINEIFVPGRPQEPATKAKAAPAEESADKDKESSAEPGADATSEKSAEPAPRAETKAQGPVLGVLFTSFIVQ